ncbi:hypothetical protein bwei_5380 [Bacillus mycoides]|nr:hypothetical protein [Bacillus mycoides]AIW87919.1 hypothetical protein bwei_5380 [Bacillus mycoides]EEL03128.1 hypothetical protein bcere0014_52970 [Bacillus cereus BDRD-ST196]GAE43256.1 hypothetical protein BW1_084_00140 [Bacillus mycoides NBRC 101238 = DSM 11821]
MLANLVSYWDKHGYNNLVMDNGSFDRLISNLATELGTDDKGDAAFSW